MVKNKGLVDTSLRGKHGRTALHIAGQFVSEMMTHAGKYFFTILLLIMGFCSHALLPQQSWIMLIVREFW
jgi:hypothetical protein